MTIESNISKNTHIGNGVTIHFPFTYKIWKKEEMLVTIEDEKGITSNITPYDVILGNNGGEVVLYIDNENKTPIPKGYTIALTRNMPFLQEQDYINGWRFNADVVEENFDIVTAELQQLLESSKRTIKVPVTSSTKPEELLNELYNARNIAVEQAGVATQQAQISTEQATLSGSYAQTANEQAVLSQQYADISQRWAESETPPDPTDENSKSAKAWAMIAADIIPVASDVLPGKVAPQYPLVTGPDGKLTYDGYKRGWGAKNLNDNISILGDADLNTVTDNGFYHVNAGTGLNRPANSPITLVVSGYDLRKLQIAYCFYENNNANNKVFVRSKYGETWSPWVQISLTSDMLDRYNQLTDRYIFDSNMYTSKIITISPPASDTELKYTPPANGYLIMRADATQGAIARIHAVVNGFTFTSGYMTILSVTHYHVGLWIPVKKGVPVSIKPIYKGYCSIIFSYAEGEL